MRLVFSCLALCGLAVLVAPRAILESSQHAQAHAASRHSSRAEDAVRRAPAPQPPGALRGRVAPGVGAAAGALAPASLTAAGKTAARRPDAPPHSRARQQAGESAPQASRLPPQPPEAFASLLESGEFEGTMGPVARLYLASFQRLPDLEGFEHYIDARDGGRRLDAIADEFAASREFAARYGALDNAQFLDRIAHNVSENGIDPAQRAWWLAQLDAGSMSRGQVMLALSESNGFRAATDNEVFVAIAYAETLQRAPEVTDWARWVAFLDAGHPRSALIEELLRTRGSG